MQRPRLQADAACWKSQEALFPFFLLFSFFFLSILCLINDFLNILLTFLERIWVICKGHASRSFQTLQKAKRTFIKDSQPLLTPRNLLSSHTRAPHVTQPLNSLNLSSRFNQTEKSVCPAQGTTLIRPGSNENNLLLGFYLHNMVLIDVALNLAR